MPKQAKATRRKAPETRRADLIAAAREAFAHKGISGTTVSDIVKAAGVAQGTFYLYFETKHDVVNAMAEEMVDAMVDAIERSVTDEHVGAVAKFLAFRDAILALANDAAGPEITAIYHRPENRAAHDRMAERITPRLVPLVESITRQGIAEGVFTAQDPEVTAWFVLGGFHLLETGFAEPAKLADAIVKATNLALRALGCATSDAPHCL
jgi:AcrR family transcriptional regulator